MPKDRGITLYPNEDLHLRLRAERTREEAKGNARLHGFSGLVKILCVEALAYRRYYDKQDAERAGVKYVDPVDEQIAREQQDRRNKFWKGGHAQPARPPKPGAPLATIRAMLADGRKTHAELTHGKLTAHQLNAWLKPEHGFDQDWSGRWGIIGQPPTPKQEYVPRPAPDPAMAKEPRVHKEPAPKLTTEERYAAITAEMRALVAADSVEPEPEFKVPPASAFKDFAPLPTDDEARARIAAEMRLPSALLSPAPEAVVAVAVQTEGRAPGDEQATTAPAPEPEAPTPVPVVEPPPPEPEPEPEPLDLGDSPPQTYEEIRARIRAARGRRQSKAENPQIAAVPEAATP